MLVMITLRACHRYYIRVGTTKRCSWPQFDSNYHIIVTNIIIEFTKEDSFLDRNLLGWSGNNVGSQL